MDKPVDHTESAIHHVLSVLDGLSPEDIKPQHELSLAEARKKLYVLYLKAMEGMRREQTAEKTSDLQLGKFRRACRYPICGA